MKLFHNEVRFNYLLDLDYINTFDVNRSYPTEFSNQIRMSSGNSMCLLTTTAQQISALNRLSTSLWYENGVRLKFIYLNVLAFV